jgi:outer membrane protein OmpA-like peptidoglycan-associated protein
LLGSLRVVGRGLALALLVTGRVTVAAPDAGAPDGGRPDAGRPDARAPDRDYDGIPDARDACPDEPEVYNGYEDADGCPERGRYRWRRPWRVQITERISFARGSHALDPATRALVGTVASVLREYPAITFVEIQGYAADDEPHPVRLAAARAATVRDALIEGGVKSVRLRARGYGATHPLCAGRDEDCRSSNRRASFSILEFADPPGRI